MTSHLSRIAVFSIGALIAGVAVAPAAAAPPTRDYVVVTSAKAALRAHSAGGLASIAARYHRESVQLTKEQAAAAEQEPGVVAVVPDVSASWVTHRAASATSKATSWGLDRIDQRSRTLDGTYAAAAYPGKGTTIIAIDSGLSDPLGQFKGRLVQGFDFVDGDTDTSDCFGHGTHVAGTLASRDYGVARSADVLPVRVLGCDGGGSTADMYLALLTVKSWVESAPELVGTVVVNMSLGASVSDIGEEAATLIEQAVADLVAVGVPVVVAAGNEMQDVRLVSPARSSAPIVVSATGRTDKRAWFANYGKSVDIFAPGEDVVSLAQTGKPLSESGTSMAAPHVSGVLARYLQRSKGSSATAVKWLFADASTTLVSSTLGSSNRLLYARTGPNAPASVAVTRSDSKHTAKLSWRAASSVSGFAVTGYIVERDGKRTTLPASARSYTWRSLKPGTKTKVSVRAVSAAGPGMAVSRAVSMLALPGKPAAASVAAGWWRDRSVSVIAHWKKPKSGTVTGYVVTAQRTSGKKEKTSVRVSSKSTSVAVKGLRWGARYTITVTAKNAAGTGAAKKSSSSAVAR